jgi:hypothetical protein
MVSNREILEGFLFLLDYLLVIKLKLAYNPTKKSKSKRFHIIQDIQQIKNLTITPFFPLW